MNLNQSAETTKQKRENLSKPTVKTTDKLTPFVKWAGGKSQLLKTIQSYLPDEYDCYYEPFIGGGALLLDVQPRKAVINDVNEQLINAYKWIKIEPNRVIQEIKKLENGECDKEKYYKNRDLYNDKIREEILDIECVALMIWLNKHCFNGLYRVNSKGLFNVPYNNRKSGKSMDENNLLGIGEYLSKNDIKIIQGDFEIACKNAKQGDFVYFDSPYIPESETASFTDYTQDGFSYYDHKRLSELYKKLDEKKVKVMLSNNNVPLVHELYKGFNIIEIKAKRMINRDASKRTGKEVIITNY